ALRDAIAALRGQGRRVRQALPGEAAAPAAAGCRSVLRQVDGQWVVVGI
ncbi:MAG: ATP phosphoribosyltransferase regulatory subunit, partial [Pseudomonadota bacterium]